MDCNRSPFTAAQFGLAAICMKALAAKAAVDVAKSPVQRANVARLRLNGGRQGDG